MRPVAACCDALTGGEDADDLRADQSTQDLHAPTLLDFEVVSALRGLTLRRHLTVARAEDALRDFEDLPLHRWAYSAPLRLRAFSLRDTLTADDAAYVALAEALDCPLVTRDARLARAGGHDVEIRVR